MKTKQVSWPERISYGLTDGGFNLIFSMISTYLMYFYTDVFGIPVAVIAPLFFIGRILDGITDPLEGILIDRTNTRWGKCRPFWLWFAIPYGIFGILTFFAPDLGLTGKIIYVYVTYICLNLLVSLVSLPTQAILPILTSDSQERTVINAVRMIAGTIGSIIVASATWPLINRLGHGDERKGFFLTSLVYGIAAAALLINGWARTKERVKVDEGKPIPVKQGLKSVLNLPWLLLLVIAIVANLCNAIRSTSTLYYLRYYLGRPDLLSTLLTVPSIFGILMIILSPLLAKKLGKRNASLIGIGISIVGSVIVIVSGKNISLLLIGTILTYMGLCIPVGLLGAMFADTVDYTEWKSGVRSTGLIYSACSMGVKAGQGVGGALGAIILTLGNYVPDVVQSPSSLAAIKFNYAWVGVIASVLMFVLLYFYKVDKLYPQIIYDLENKRK